MESLSRYYLSVSGDHLYEDDIDIDYEKELRSAENDAELSDDSVSGENDD